MKIVWTLVVVASMAMVACDSSNGGSTDTNTVQDPGTTDLGGQDVPAVDPGEDRDTIADLGQTDTSMPDLGPADLGPTDLGPTDPGTIDPGVQDPGQPDLGPTDPGTVDPGTPDPGVTDLGPQPPAGHTENNGGVFHKPGKNDPLTNCVACHGASLQGDVGPSCYDCHNNDNHTSIRGGHKHLSGSSSTCKACHGPNNNGGLGPACSECH
jgi:hypothetical protein